MIPFREITGLDEKEAEVLKIALCGKYQRMYSDIETLCKNSGLWDEAAKEVKGWKYHGREADPLILLSILEYIKEYEAERYSKALYIYYKNTI